MNNSNDTILKQEEILENSSKRRFTLKMPHNFIILSIVLIIFAALAHFIPAGEFDRIKDAATGKMVVVPGSYHPIEGNPPGIFDLFISVQKGFIAVADIIFFIIFAYGFVHMLVKNGTLDAILGSMIRRLGDKVELLIPVIMFAFGILGATFGMYEEVYGLFPVFIGIAISLGYDALVGGGMLFVGVATGFAAAITNPFTLGVAQGIAGVPMFSGAAFRTIVFIIFEGTAVLYIWRYARKVKANPEASYLYGTELELAVSTDREELVKKRFTVRHKLCTLLFILTIVAIMYGTMQLGWYINELAALFLMMMIVVGKIGGFTFDEICSSFTESTKSVVGGILACGICRAILIVLNDAKVCDTIVNFMVNMLQGTSTYISAVGMLGIQNMINFFISGGSSQATITMPIMAPISELIGLNKQIAVLAFQFGDGFSNMFWPTSVAFICGLMGVPINKWYRFMAPLFGIMLGLQIVFMLIATAINYA